MWRKLAKDYFSFTKKERTGAIVLLVLVAVFIIAPYFFPRFVQQHNDPRLWEAAKAELVQRTPVTDSVGQYDEGRSPRRYTPYARKWQSGDRQYELFPFDPNTLPAEDWKRLGLRDKTIQTIRNFIAHGGNFRRAEDLQKIYGLHADELARLMPYVQIADPEEEPAPAYATRGGVAFAPRARKSFVVSVDINTADTNAFKALPGIGSRLAYKIVNFRDKLGGFYAPEQVAETRGLPDSTFQKIKPLLQTGAVPLRKININTADAAALSTHPYINWSLANAIVAYRRQHGSFRQASDLEKLALMTGELLGKLIPYIEF
jgi:competence protein ComEA